MTRNDFEAIGSKAVRPYRSKDHLRATIDHPLGHEHGAITITPQAADRIVFDVASANHLPANLPDGMHGSRVLDIGGGVAIRASGCVTRESSDAPWMAYRDLYGNQYPSGRPLTAAQERRARSLIEALITEWARTHESDVAQADDIERNNAARTLEEAIARHEEALTILRDELAACEAGQPYLTYPDVPTKR